MSLRGLTRFRKRIEGAIKRWPAAQMITAEAERRYTILRMKQNRVQGPPLARSTIRRKKSSIKLIDTGRLLRSIRVVYVNKNVVMLASNVTYAGVHQYGYKNIPQRKYLFVTRSELKELGKIFIKVLMK
mgnify:CR=1 FL=1